VRMNTASAFYTLTPCRAIDTRLAPGPLGGPALAAEIDRTFTLAGACGIPATARAVAANIVVIEPPAAGSLRFYPARASVPLATSITYAAGQTRSSNAIVGLSAGAFTVFTAQGSGSVHLLLDVTGYFQ